MENFRYSINCHVAPMVTALLVAGVLGGTAPAAFAQVGSVPVQSQSVKPEQTSNLEEIVVTARKKTERLIDVPAAVTVLNQDVLERYATTGFENVSTQIPQVMFTKSLGASTGAIVTIRGIGSNNSADDSIEQAVSFNIDNVSSARGQLQTQALFDLSDVQVLKGPQALYFGKNSPGGVIVVESKDPTAHWEGYVTGSNEFQAREYHFEGAVGGPITDTLGVRVAFFHDTMLGGYIHNGAGPIPATSSPVAFDKANGYSNPGAPYADGPGSVQTAGRITITYKPSDSFEANFKFLGADYADNGDVSSIVDTHCPVGFNKATQEDLGALLFTGSVGLASDPYSNCQKGTRTQYIGTVPPQVAAQIPGSNGGIPFSHTRSYLGALTLNYTMPGVTWTSVTGFYHSNNNRFDCYDETSLCLIPSTFQSDSTTWSEELRAATSFNGPVNLTAGGFYSYDWHDFPYISGLIRASDPIAGGHIYSVQGDSIDHNTSYSFFAEANWKIIPDLELAAGARYSDEKKHASLGNSYVQPGLVSESDLALPAGQNVVARLHETNISPQATLTYHLSTDETFFVGYKTGFKSGGIDNPGLIPVSATAANVVYRDETVKGVEGGFKFRTPHRQLSGDITAYHYEFSGLQVSAFDVITNTVTLKNAGGANTTGVEADLNYLATDELTLHVSAGYNRATYSTFINSQCWGGQTAAQGCVNSKQDLSGQPLPRAPSWSGMLGATWDQDIGDTMSIGFTLDGRLSTGYFTSPQDSPYAHQGGFGTLDASFRLHDVNDKWEVAIIGRNLTNTYYVTFSNDKPLAIAPGSEYGLLGAPVTLTLQGTYRF